MKVPYGFLGLPLRWLERHFGWHLCVTASCAKGMKHIGEAKAGETTCASGAEVFTTVNVRGG
ncbi:MAG: hypothetical protein QXH03_11150 [Candidatus Bathyarchaeia archaeon]